MLNLTELIGFGVGGGDAHLYWRVYVTQGTLSDTAIRLSELYMYSLAGGADVTTGGTPFSGYTACDIGFGFIGGSAGNSALPFNGTQYSGESWDGYAIAWGDADNTFTIDCPTWIGYQFATPEKIVQFAWAYPGGTLGANSGPTDFHLQWADSPSGPWTTVFTKTGETWTGINQTKTYTVP